MAEFPPNETRVLTQSRETLVVDDLDASMSELVAQIDGVSRDSQTSAAARPEINLPMAVSGVELLPQSSLDYELDRILGKLELLHRSLQSARALPESTSFPGERIITQVSSSAMNRKRTSLAFFTSRVKTRERREFVIGLSLALSSPLVSRKSGSGRNWKILIGCNAIILTTFWLWAQYLSRYEAAPTPQTAVESTLLAASKPSASALPPVKDNQLESPAAQKHVPRKASKVSGQPRVQALEIPSMVQAEPGEQAGDSPESNEPVAVPANAESLMAIRKIASRAEALLSATESPVTDSGDGEPGPSGVLLPKADQPGARETVEARLIPSIKFLPVYPETARRKDIRGDVDLLVSIDEQGKVVGATVVSGPSELHAPALEAVLRWYFKPVRVDGVNAPVTGKFTMSFDEQIR